MTPSAGPVTWTPSPLTSITIGEEESAYSAEIFIKHDPKVVCLLGRVFLFDTLRSIDYILLFENENRFH